MTADAQVAPPVQDGERSSYASYIIADGTDAYNRNIAAYNSYGNYDKATDQAMADRMAALMSKPAENQQYSYSTPQNYTYQGKCI